MLKNGPYNIVDLLHSNKSTFDFSWFIHGACIETTTFRCASSHP